MQPLPDNKTPQPVRNYRLSGKFIYKLIKSIRPTTQMIGRPNKEEQSHAEKFLHFTPKLEAHMLQNINKTGPQSKIIAKAVIQDRIRKTFHIIAVFESSTFDEFYWIFKTLDKCGTLAV